MVKEILVDTEALPFRSLSKRESSPWRSLRWHPVVEDGFWITLCCHTPPHSPRQCNDKQGDAVRTPSLLSAGASGIILFQPHWVAEAFSEPFFLQSSPSILTFTDLMVKSCSDVSLPTFIFPMNYSPKIFFSSNFFSCSLSLLK